MSAYGIPLGRLYGPGWLNGKIWCPGFKSVWTAEKDQSGHHCPDKDCAGAIKTSCYKKLHVAFCICTTTMPSGQLIFCGHRFQVESPKACALHGWGGNDENRLFQRAKKGLPFELPKLLPHEQPEWEMVLSSLGSIQTPIHIRMGLIDGELCFVRVLPWFVDGHSDQVTELARVKAKEVLLTVTDPRDALVAHKTVVEDPARDAIKTLVKIEQKDNEYNNPFSYQKYKAFNLKIAAATKLEEKKAKEVKAMAQAAERLASNKNGRKCGDRALKVYKQILQGQRN